MSGAYNGNKKARVQPCPFCANQREGTLVVRTRLAESAWVECTLCGARGPVVSSNEGWLVPSRDESGKAYKAHERIALQERALNVKACTAWDDRAALAHIESQAVRHG